MGGLHILAESWSLCSTILHRVDEDAIFPRTLEISQRGNGIPQFRRMSRTTKHKDTIKVRNKIQDLSLIKTGLISSLVYICL